MFPEIYFYFVNQEEMCLKKCFDVKWMRTFYSLSSGYINHSLSFLIVQLFLRILHVERVLIHIINFISNWLDGVCYQWWLATGGKYHKSSYLKRINPWRKTKSKNVLVDCIPISFSLFLFFFWINCSPFSVLQKYFRKQWAIPYFLYKQWSIVIIK